jgi:hypothetical protein
MPENRLHNRIVFSADDKTSVNFYDFNTDKIIYAKVVNVSKGGICIAISKDDCRKIPKKGDKIVLLKIESSSEKLNFPLNADLKITWALTDETLDKIGIGCKFENLTDRNKDQIEEFLMH